MKTTHCLNVKSELQNSLRALQVAKLNLLCKVVLEAALFIAWLLTNIITVHSFDLRDYRGADKIPINSHNTNGHYINQN